MDEEIKDRLKAARIAAGFDDATTAANRFGWTVSTYLGHENGDRNPRLPKAKEYAKAFKVRWEWLYHGDGPRAVGAEKLTPLATAVPVLSWVSAGRLEPVLNAKPIRVEHLVLPKGDWAALEVRGDSMDRIAPEGSLIVVDRSDKNLRDGRFYVVSIEDQGDATFKRFRAKPDRLAPFSMNPDNESIPMQPDMRVFGRVRRVITEL